MLVNLAAGKCRPWSNIEHTKSRGKVTDFYISTKSLDHLGQYLNINVFKQIFYIQNLYSMEQRSHSGRFSFGKNYFFYVSTDSP